MHLALRSMLAAGSVALLTLSATVLPAQGSLREQTAGLAGGVPQHILSINPFLPLAGYFQGEYERRVQGNVSVAVGASYVPWNRDIFNADVKLRLYPQERALEGLGFAAGLGFGRTRQDFDSEECVLVECVTPPPAERMISAPTFSIELHHQWLLGASRSTAVTIGGGAKRYFISDADAVNITRVLPTGRLTIGWAFR